MYLQTHREKYLEVKTWLVCFPSLSVCLRSEVLLPISNQAGQYMSLIPIMLDQIPAQESSSFTDSRAGTQSNDIVLVSQNQAQLLTSLIP